MQLVQGMVADLLSARHLNYGLLRSLEDFARFGTEAVRRCMARAVVKLMQSESIDANDFFRFLHCVRYNLGRHEPEVVKALLHKLDMSLRTANDAKLQEAYFSNLQAILKARPSPGKRYPFVWVCLNYHMRQAPKDAKQLVRRMWLLLGDTWSRRACAEDPQPAYHYCPSMRFVLHPCEHFALKRYQAVFWDVVDFFDS